VGRSLIAVGGRPGWRAFGRELDRQRDA